jgi:hypothetical protein
MTSSVFQDLRPADETVRPTIIRLLLRRPHCCTEAAASSARFHFEDSRFESLPCTCQIRFVFSSWTAFIRENTQQLEAMATTVEEKKASAQRSRDMKDDGRDQRLMSKSGVMEKKDQDAYAKIAIHACDSFWKKFNDCAKGVSRASCLCLPLPRRSVLIPGCGALLWCGCVHGCWRQENRFQFRSCAAKSSTMPMRAPRHSTFLVCCHHSSDFLDIHRSPWPPWIDFNESADRFSTCLALHSSAAHPYEEYRDARNAERAKEALVAANQ